MSINKIIVNGLLFFISCSPYNLHKIIINSETIDDPNEIISDEIFADPREQTNPHEITNSETIAKPSSGSWKWPLIKYGISVTWPLIKYGIFGAVCYYAGIGNMGKLKALKQSNENIAAQLRSWRTNLYSVNAKMENYESLKRSIVRNMERYNCYDELLTQANIQHERIKD
jgi:hypothetical protein